MQDKPRGRGLSLAAIVIAVAVIVLIAIAPSSQAVTAGRIAAIGGVVFLVAVLYGSSRYIAMSSLPVLGAALMNLSAAPGEAWGQSIAIGVLWYLASEFAWGSIDTRTIAGEDSNIEARRSFELAVVVAISVVITIVGSIGSIAAPDRNLAIVAGATLAVVSGIVYVTRYVRAEAAPQMPSEVTQPERLRDLGT